MNVPNDSEAETDAWVIIDGAELDSGVFSARKQRKLCANAYGIWNTGRRVEECPGKNVAPGRETRKSRLWNGRGIFEVRGPR